MINFMTDKENAFLCAKFICLDNDSLSEPINDLLKKDWGTDCEIHIIVSMLHMC